MNKASKPGGAKKPIPKRPALQQRSTKPAQPRKAQSGAGLAGVVAQLAQSAEQLAQAADRLADAAKRLSVTAEAQHETLKTRDQSTPDSTASPQEFEAAAETDGE
jgi:methylphosphotriester-DNA--protein-cysteine methyltransferase